MARSAPHGQRRHDAPRSASNCPRYAGFIFGCGLGGATTRFELLPHKSHGDRARENILPMLGEMETRLDVHVKAAATEKAKSEQMICRDQVA